VPPLILILFTAKPAPAAFAFSLLNLHLKSPTIERRKWKISQSDKCWPHSVKAYIPGPPTLK
jgi:hypothetical protein